MASQRRLKLGSFVSDEHGILHGKISGLGIGSTSVLTEEAISQGGLRYLKLIADPMRDGYEVGAAFPKEKNGQHYYSVQIDSPLFSGPLNAELRPDGENELGFNLVWYRPEASKPSVEAKADASQTQGQAQGRSYKGIVP